MDIYIAGKTHHLTATDAIGKGGEADVFKISGGRVVKIYKQPDHPDLMGLDHEQQAAKNRLIEQQQKLPAFPKNLPTNRVVVPMELATDKSGQIVGFSGSNIIKVTHIKTTVKEAINDAVNMTDDKVFSQFNPG